MKDDATSQGRTLKSVRLTDEQLSEVMSRLDEDSAAGMDPNRREADHYSYKHKGLVVTLQQPGGNTASFLVPTRNLSSTGLSFLHGGFVHIGTRCSAQLVTVRNMWHTVEGAVIRCQYVEGLLHEVGLRFDREIDVAMYAQGAGTKRILVVDDDAPIRRLVSFHLKKLNAKVTTAEDGEAGLAEAMARPFDCVLLDVEMPGQDGFETIALLRQQGYTGMVVALTGLTQPEDRARCLEAGFNEYMPKPVTREALSDLLSRLDEEPLFSSLADEHGMDELITQFVADLVSATRSIEQAAAQNDLAQLESLCRNLKGDAGGYGFEPSTEVAEKVEEAARNRVEHNVVQMLVKELAKLCALVRAPNVKPTYS